MATQELVPYEDVVAGLCSPSDIVAVITYSSMAASIERAALLAALTFDPWINTLAQVCCTGQQQRGIGTDALYKDVVCS